MALNDRAAFATLLRDIEAVTWLTDRQLIEPRTANQVLKRAYEDANASAAQKGDTDDH